MIIDFHTHCFTDALAPRAMANLAKNSLYPPRYDGTLSGLKASMKEAGIDVSVVLNIATNGRQTLKVNDWAIASDNEEGIVSFGSIHPDYDDFRGEIARLKSAGIKGIKFHPDYQGFFVDERRMYPIYEAIAAEGMMMIFHCGKDLVLREPYRCPPERFARVARDLRGAVVVGAHLGGQGMWEEVFGRLIGRDVYLDTSFGFKFLAQPQIGRVLSEHDPDKILFATDTPWQKQSVEVEEMRRFVRDPDLLDRIFYRNAAKLLGL